MEEVLTSPAVARPASWRLGAVLFLVIVGSLVTYKTSASLATLERASQARTLAARSELLPVSGMAPWARPVVRALNYLAIVWPALVFGVLIGAAVRAALPAGWMAAGLGGSSLQAHLLGGLAGAPAPSLNPAALALTFLLFPKPIALARAGMAAAVVFGLAALLGRGSREQPPGVVLDAPVAPPPAQELMGFARETWRLGRETLPLIVLGVVLSAALVEVWPVESLSSVSPTLVIGVAALLSLPIALPTFAEIPIALGLLAGGAPAGAATAVLVAGPAINLASLLTVASEAGTRKALLLAGGTFVAALAGGLLT